MGQKEGDINTLYCKICFTYKMDSNKYVINVLVIMRKIMSFPKSKESLNVTLLKKVPKHKTYTIHQLRRTFQR